MQNLLEPKTDKETSERGNVDFLVGISSMQGWRPYMEDALCVQLPLDEGDQHSAYFAVFDGHGSQHFSTHCGKQLHKVILQSAHFCEERYEPCLKESFHSLDLSMKKDKSLNLWYEVGGTTAVVVILKDNHVFCANAGDSRAIACVGGQCRELSHDHKPTMADEERRIYQAGGWVEINRVNGILALSRALGDFEFKGNKDLSAEEQVVTADPDVTSHLISSDYEFLVLASDGVWDVMTNEEVVQFVRSRIAQQMKPAEICEVLLDQCLAPDCRMGGVGCDNMTVILASFLHGGSYADLARRTGLLCDELTSVPSATTPLEDSVGGVSGGQCGWSRRRTVWVESAEDSVGGVGGGQCGWSQRRTVWGTKRLDMMSNI